MISLDDHLTRIRSVLVPLGTEKRATTAAHGCIVREPVVSAIDLPPWPNSAMDGYAVHAEDLAEASTSNPITLPVVGDIAAGDTAQHVLAPGSAMRIMTGAAIPAGCSAVVPLEKTAHWDESAPTAGAALAHEVTFLEPASSKANIRAAGEDVRQGSTIIEPGTLLTPNRVAALAAIGVADVLVSKQLRVAVMSTGSELVPLGHALQFGQIHDSNGPLLAALVEEFGAQLVMQQRVDDDADKLRTALTDAQSTADVIILTGGASVGAYDTTREVFEGTGGNGSVQFDKVAMQPGKPQGFGRLDDGTYVFALPGNPVSVWVSWYVIVEPALRTLLGRADADPLWHLVSVAEGWKSPEGREQFMPVRIVSGPGEPLRIVPAGSRGSGSHLAASLAQATGIARVPVAISEVRENEMVLMRGLS